MSNDRTFIIGDLATLRPRFKLAYLAGEAMMKAGRGIEIIVRERKSKRSIEQNKRYWAMLREIAATVWLDGRQFSDEVWHEQFRRMFIGMDEIIMPDGTTLIRGISTTTLSVAEFSEYMQRIEHWCVEQGYQIMENAI